MNRRGGKFESQVSDEDLPDAVQTVALRCRPDDPTSVPRPEFNRRRHELPEHAGLPTAQRISARLGLPWQPLLRLLFNPRRDVRKTIALRAGQRHTKWITIAHVISALRAAAVEGDVDTLQPDDYAELRITLLGRDRRRWMHGGRLVLPTVGQIERVAGGWDPALELAGLEPRTPTTGNRTQAHTVEEALHMFLETYGTLPTRRELEAWVHAQKIPMRRMSQPWSGVVRQVAADRATRGLATPAQPPPPELRPDISAPVELDGVLGGKRKKRRTWDDCIDWLIEYLDQLRGRRARQKDYNAFAARHPDAPWSASFEQHGGWTALLAEARAERRRRRRAQG